MARLPQPLAEIDHRIPEAGRIRLGVKTGKGMKSLDTFRFTSPDEGVVRRLAELYGGVAQPWRDPKASPSDQWEVITEAKEVEVYLPANALSVWYELWSGGGVQRRCDGEMCQIPQTSPGGWEMVETPCVCVQRNMMECRPYTRMNVILPSIPFRGVWRLETKGWNAAKELPGMVNIIEAMTNAGQLVQAKLHIERRVQQTPAGKRNFVVPGITIAHTAQDMLAGAADVRGISAGPSVPPVAELGSAPVLVEAEIVDAEIVDDEFELLLDQLRDLAAEHRLNWDKFWHGISTQIKLSSPVSDEHKSRLRTAISRIAEGSLTPLGFNADGSIIWRKQ
jgi:hypothetical protein